MADCIFMTANLQNLTLRDLISLRAVFVALTFTVIAQTAHCLLVKTTTATPIMRYL